jgi:hypothetical protein
MLDAQRFIIYDTHVYNLSTNALNEADCNGLCGSENLHFLIGALVLGERLGVQLP